jgi:glycerophosphoryl diester phosphodiesterase
MGLAERPGRPLAIAHAHGNRRERIEAAIEAGVDLIETDLRYEGGRVVVRHEHRLARLPVVFNRDLRGVHRQAPHGCAVGRWWFRFETRPMPFAEVVRAASGRAGLLIDLKAGRYSARQTRAFAVAVFGMLEACGFEGAIDFCGSWALLDAVRAARPDQAVHYSVDSGEDWERLRGRLDGATRIPAITLKRSLLTSERAGVLARAGLPFYCWDVESEADVVHALGHGAAGIIADDLDLLSRLRRGAFGPIEGRH